MICIMHDGTPYGHLTINNKAATAKQLGAITGVSEKEATKLLAELEHAGVFSRTELGMIFSRRMVRDWDYELKHKNYGKKGGNPELTLAPDGSVPEEERVRRLKPDKNPTIFRRVFDDANGQCELCGVILTRDTPYAANSYQLDHIKEIKDGGTNDRDNLRALCRKCNMSRNLIPASDVSVNGVIDGGVKGSSDGRDMFLETDSKNQIQTPRKREPPKPPVPGGRAPGSDSDPDFVAFWEAYPRKDDKGHARNAWKTAICSAKPAEIVAGCRGYRFDPNPKYQPLPATWLRGERWLQAADSDGMDPVLKAAGVTQAMLDEYLGTANDAPIFKGKLIQ